MSAIAEAKDKVTSAEDDVASTEYKMAEAKDKMASAEDDVASAEDDVASAENKMVSAEDKMASAEDKMVEDDVAKLRTDLVNSYMIGEEKDGSFENTKKANSGKKWKQLMKMIAGGETRVNVQKAIDDIENKTLAANMNAAIDRIFNSPPTIATIQLDSQTNETQKTMDECKMRIKSFFDMVRKEVGTNGFFLCQEDDYTTFGLMTDFFNPGEQSELFSGLKYIHAIKLGKNNAPITSATMIDGILSSCPENLVNKDGKGKNLGRPEWGDGVTIFFGKDWTCEQFTWSSGGKATVGTGILIASFDASPAPAATEVICADAFIVGIFNNNENKIQIATTHLESGDTILKDGEKDKKRVSTITEIIELTVLSIPTIYGFDGNSSAYSQHTLVVDNLRVDGFESAIDGHTIQTDMVYDEGSHLMSSLKQRGWMTEQPWKPDPISYLIDYLVYKGDVSVVNRANVPIGSATLMGKYALPSSWLNFNLPEPDNRGKIEEWKEWASDHIAVGAVFKIGEFSFKVTTLNALAIPLTLDGFSKGSEWQSAKASLGGKRTRRRRNRKTRRRRRRSRRGRK
jgi:hypothetical protein